MSHPTILDFGTLKYIVTHVFCPLQLPDGDDHSLHGDHSLAAAVVSTARLYGGHIDPAHFPEWNKHIRMLDNLSATVKIKNLDASQVISQLSNMNTGDSLAFLIRARHAAVIFRRHQEITIYESFGVSPKAENVMAAQGKLICSYPGPAIKVPNDVFDNEAFRSELVNFLRCMNDDVLDATMTTRKTQSDVPETRDLTHLHYITELLTGILRSVGSPVDVIRISKRVGDDVVSNNSKAPWRRSPLWLMIRVALQTSLHRPALENHTYKSFMLFFMCCLAQEKIATDFPSDLLRFMSAKISRRLRKLGPASPDWLSQIALQTCTSLRSILDGRWREVQTAQRVSLTWTPSELNLTQDTQLSLPKSMGYIHNCLSDHCADPVNMSFNPKLHLRGSLDTFMSSDGAFFDEAYHLDPYIALYDVEKAVEESIDGWVDQVTDSDDACMKLETLGKKYSSSARKTYQKNPELLSVMLLTTIELWIALDKITTKVIPMLADYSPEIPTNLLEHLLLRKAASLNRLCLAHQYLSRRYFQCRSEWSVFSQTISTNSFAVRFYRGSPNMKSLRTQVEADAQLKVQEKLTELKELNNAHHQLQQKMNQVYHEYTVGQEGQKHHNPRCVKCSLEKECDDMRIVAYEWPLPADQLLVETVIFELDAPVSFNMWRNATFCLLVDICSPHVSQRNLHTLLTKYKALQRYLSPKTSRITLASDTAPLFVMLPIPASEERACVDNRMDFFGYDIDSGIPVWKVLESVDIRRYCKYELPSGSYKTFQKYIDGTFHSSNKVIANQADCPKDLSIHEYTAFAHLRSGELLQWLNVLRELRARSLTFRRPEVHYLFAQAVSQVGPVEKLPWHQEIREPSFCYTLLGELGVLVQDVKANWLEGVTMDTISLLLRRLLASTPDPTVSLQAIELLCTIHRNVFSWVLELASKLARTPGDEESRRILRDNAVICRSTFDVDPMMIPKLLHSTADIELLICSAVFVHDNSPSMISSLPPYSQLLLDRDRRLSLVLEHALSDALQADFGSRGLELAVKRIWPDYVRGSKWTVLEDPHSHWFSCTTAQTARRHPQEVHYNLLDGSLLVDGKPLGRLPNDIFQHPVYSLIFGEKLLDVIPSGLDGMDYSTRDIISNHQVHFALRGKDLVIQAQRVFDRASELFELIPQEKMKGDLPAALIEGHVHWLNVSTSSIEIRPLDSRWESSSENWRMCCTPGNYRLERGNQSLVDIHSKSWDMVSSLLKPLDSSQNLIVSVSVDSTERLRPQLSVVLPRYGLSFYVDEDGDLQSHNMRGMIFDEDQSVGTLFGLVNRLVLRPKARNPHFVDLIARCVIIPEGEISFKQDGHHVCVEVDTSGSAIERVAYQTYRVNLDLGCLTGTVSLANKLYRAYLHALTSGCGADPLTGKFGTEEALSLLRSADCWSITKFTPKDANLLRLIASLCPHREASNVTAEQRIKWHNLPPSSQHHEFYVVSKAIKDHYEKLQLFHENPPSHKLFKEFPRRDSDLLERSARRMEYLFPFQFSWKPSAGYSDIYYPDDTVAGDGSRLYRIYTAAAAIFQRTTGTVATTDIVSMAESWKGTICGDSSFSLTYDKSWLTPNLPLIWLKTYNLLRTNGEGKWHQLLFSIPAMVFASPELVELVPVLLAFALCPQFCSENPPSYDSYDLSGGYSPSLRVLCHYVSSCAHSFENSLESLECSGRKGETPDDLGKRLQMYRSRINADADATAKQLLDAWPCEMLQDPFCSLNSNLYDVPDFMSIVQKYFARCYHNLKLKQHLVRVQNILNELPSPATLVLGDKYSFHPLQGTQNLSPIAWSITADHLFARAPPSLRVHNRLPKYRDDADNPSFSGSTQLHQLIAAAEANADNQFQRKYVSALRASAEWSETDMLLTIGKTKIPSIEKLLLHISKFTISFSRHFGVIFLCFRKSVKTHQN